MIMGVEEIGKFFEFGLETLDPVFEAVDTLAFLVIPGLFPIDTVDHMAAIGTVSRHAGGKINPLAMANHPLFPPQPETVKFVAMPLQGAIHALVDFPINEGSLGGIDRVLEEEQLVVVSSHFGISAEGESGIGVLFWILDSGFWILNSGSH